jgi:hypothetical protein
LALTYYIIVRSHYYGPATGPWHLLLDESGEPVTFTSRKEAIAAVNPTGFNHNEYACEFRVLSDGNNEAMRIERRLNTSSPQRRNVKTI